MAKTKQGPDSGKAATETRRGALACVDALRDIETVAELANTPDQTTEQHWQVRQATVDILLRAAGPTSPYLSGFLSALAEFVDFTITSGTPNLEGCGWEPKAAMTDAEFAAYQQQVERDMAD